MWYSYAQCVEMFGKERADTMFHQAWVPKEKEKKKTPELTDKEYIKLSEYEHGKRFVKYVRENYSEIKFTHIWNEAGQAWSKNIVIMMAKKKASWVSKWFPDYVISVPGINHYNTLYMELKKAKGTRWGWNGSLLSTEQAEWLNHLQDHVCSYVSICHWYKEAIDTFETYVNQLKDKTLEYSVQLWNDSRTMKQDYLTLVNETNDSKCN